MYGMKIYSDMSGYTSIITAQSVEKIKRLSGDIETLFCECVNSFGYDFECANANLVEFLHNNALKMYATDYHWNRNINDIGELYDANGNLNCQIIVEKHWRF